MIEQDWFETCAIHHFDEIDVDGWHNLIYEMAGCVFVSKVNETILPCFGTTETSILKQVLICRWELR